MPKGFFGLRLRLLFVMMPLFGVAQSCAADTAPLSADVIEAKLYDLKPLPKVHYFWPFVQRMEISSRTLYEMARITHTLCVVSEYTDAAQVDRYVYTCARVNKTDPSIKASLGVIFAPWHQKFGKDLPPTDRGPGYYEEIDHFCKRASMVRTWVEESNKKYQSDIQITALILNCERFVVRAGDERWNEGIRQALDAIHTQAQSLFPNARIEWYERGIRGFNWSKSPYWTGKEIKTSLSCSLYTVPELDHMREIYRRTCKLADEMGVSDVTPYVSLAAGTRRMLLGVRYDPDWRYDVIYSYLIGAELNNKWYSEQPEKYAPYDRAKVIFLYPPPFDPKTPDWARHFIAYVRGATEVKELADLGYKE